MTTSDPRYRVLLNKSCLCYPCWSAKCSGCGAWLTKHAWTAEEADAEAAHEFTRTDGRGHACGSPVQLSLLSTDPRGPRMNTDQRRREVG